jgi:hypothetical protein
VDVRVDLVEDVGIQAANTLPIKSTYNKNSVGMAGLLPQKYLLLIQIGARVQKHRKGYARVAIAMEHIRAGSGIVPPI